MVLGSEGPGLYRVALGRDTLLASSTAELETGALLKARVERSGASILLRLQPSSSQAESRPQASLAAALRPGAGESLAALLRSAGLPNDAAGRLAASALLREGLAPDARALGRVRRAAFRDAEAADLAAKMEAKGLPAEGRAFEELLALASSLGLGGGSGGQGGRQDGGREPYAEEAGGELSLIEEEELPPVLGAFLRGLAQRSAAGDSLPAQEALGLFNQLRGPEGSWVMVPFRFALDAVDFSGYLHIQLPYVRGGQGLLEARFTASRPTLSESWAFSLSFGGGRASSLRIEAPELGYRSNFGAQFKKLATELASHSCTVRLSSRGDEKGDEVPSDGERGLDLDV